MDITYSVIEGVFTRNEIQSVTKIWTDIKYFVLKKRILGQMG